MTDFQKLGVYLNFLVVVLEGGKRNNVNQNMIGAIRKENALHKQIEMQMALDANSKESNDVNIQTTPTIPETRKRRNMDDVTTRPMKSIKRTQVYQVSSYSGSA